jgi:hypothetical protein
MLCIELFVTLAAMTFCACETTSGLPTGGSNDLAELPLTAASRAKVTQVLTNWSDPNMMKSCSDAEIEFLRASFLGYAVFQDVEATAPWSAAEQARVEALIQKVERLGGDASKVSSACDAYVKANAP